jgi:hypothetical protein
MFRIFSETNVDAKSDQLLANRICAHIREMKLVNIEKLSQEFMTDFVASWKAATVDIGYTNPQATTLNENKQIVNELIIAIKKALGNSEAGRGLAGIFERNFRCAGDVVDLLDVVDNFGIWYRELASSAAMLAPIGFRIPDNKQQQHNNINYTNNKRKIVQNEAIYRVDKHRKTSTACNGCGRQGHAHADCKAAAYHPDFNKDANKPWDQSTQGQAWKQRDKPVLPFKEDLAGHTYNVPSDLIKKRPLDEKNKKCECTYSLTYINTLSTNNAPYIPVILHSPKETLSLEALLDSGATGASVVPKFLYFRNVFTGVVHISGVL